MTGDEVKEEIKRRIDIVELVSQYVPLQRAGRRFGARCPFHQEKTPSFYVDPERGHWKCFGCGAYGDIFSFVMQVEGLTFPEAAERLAEKAGVEWKPKPGAERTGRERQTIQKANEAAADFFRHNLESPQGGHAREYLQSRGITPQSVLDFRLGLALPGWDNLVKHLAGQGFNETLLQQAGLAKPRPNGGVYDVFRNRLIFPIVDVSGRVVAFGGRALDPEEPAKYLNSPETALFKKGATFYGLNLARTAITESKTALVVEGYIDVIALVQAGFSNTLACLGTATTPEHLRLLSRYAENVIFVFDGDAAGMRAALRNISVFEGSNTNCRIAVLPPGQDPDDCIRTGGAVAFQACLDAAVSFPEYQIRMGFGQYDLSDADGRLRAAREAVDVLLKVGDSTRRAELVDRVADWWAQTDPMRGEALSKMLRLELGRRHAEQRGALRRTDSPRDRGRILQTMARHAGPVQPAVLRLEALVLSAALNSAKATRALAAKVDVADFANEQHRRIAQALYEQVSENDFLPQDAVDALPEEEGLRGRAVELLVSCDELSEEVFTDCIEKILYYKAARGLRPEYEVAPASAPVDEETSVAVSDDGEDYEAWRRRVAAAIAQGVLTRDHPDFIRFMRLGRRFRGAGRDGIGEYAGTTPLSADEGPLRPRENGGATAPDERSAEADERS